MSVLWCSLPLMGRAAQTQEAHEASRGIAVLASSIGNEYPVEPLADFVERGHFSPVVVDWAWITAHWDRTNFAEVNRLIAILSERGVEVMAMYRPRFIGQATVPVQVTGEGKPLTSDGHSEICYSSEQARQWGLWWGQKILDKCPAFDEVIIYNPQDHCECPKCVEAREAGRYAAVLRFLADARMAWRKHKPEAKLGVAFPPVANFWKQAKDIVDVAHPLLSVREKVDFGKELSGVRNLRGALGKKMQSCLAKVTWGENDRVSPNELATFDSFARVNDVSYFFWTFDTLFLSSLYDLPALLKALGLEPGLMVEHVQRLSAAADAARLQSGDKVYTEEEIHKTDTETLFQRMVVPQAGYHRLSAMWALIVKARNGDAATTTRILKRALELIEDRSRPADQRWQCCYVLSGIRDERAIPALARILLKGEGETDRAVAACALGYFGTEQARRALQQAAAQETSAYVLEVIHKAMQMQVKGPVPVPVAKPPAGQVSVAEGLSGKRVTIVLVKDYMRMGNTGPALADVEFKRYFPVVDEEQIVAGRWVEAQNDAGEDLVISIAKVAPDEQGNLVHTYRLSRFPEKQQVLVTVTSLVARRERPAPRGEFPIRSPRAYPTDVRAFLSSTTMVGSDHPEVKKQAEELLAYSRDAYQVAQELAKLMKAKSYLPSKTPEIGLPTAASVLRYGGSCCGSAVCAAAILRACGIPAQITYCPAGYIHGIIRFYLNGYGWVRMDSTCGVGKLPLMQMEGDLGLVRLFDMPIEMECIRYAYAWPYYHNDEHGKYQFLSKGQVCTSVCFSHKGQPGPDGVAGRVAEPFPHLESGSWNRVLGSELNEGAWKSWDTLVKASRKAAMSGTMGEFPAVTGKLPGLAKYVAAARNLGKTEPRK